MEQKEIALVPVRAIAAYLLAEENATSNMCHLEKSLCKYVLVNTNNVYCDNNASPRKQHFSTSQCLLGHESK